MKIIMFHYVVPSFNYYHFDLSLFEKIIKKLVSQYKVISIKEFDYFVKNNQKLDDNYFMLTFDDGTIDHYKYVYPILKKYNCSGLFFIPSSFKNKKVLDIQLIHNLISLVSIDELISDITYFCQKFNFDIMKFNENILYKLKDEKISFVKSLLQYKIPENIRIKLLDYLCDKYKISKNVNDYYMNEIQMKEMKNNNMFFGIHTVNHKRLEKLNKKNQYYEIKNNLFDLQSFELLDKNLYVIAYPFGSYNDETISILKELNFAYGFKVNETNKISNLEINRIDCNCLKGDKFYE